MTDWESIDTLGLPEERSVADDWPSASPCLAVIALGNDGDSQAPIVSAPTTTNKVTPGLNTFDMFDLARKLKISFSARRDEPDSATTINHGGFGRGGMVREQWKVICVELNTV